MGPLGLPILHHCTKFGAIILIDVEIMAENRNPRCGRPPPWIFENLICTVDFPSGYQIWCKNIDRRPKSKSKMVAVRHLGIDASSYRTTHEVFVGPYQPVKFYANAIHSFKDMAIWIFFQIWLEMPIHAPKFRFWGCETLNAIGHYRDPQKAHPWPEPHLHANFGTYPSTGATCARDEEIKKEKRQGKKLTVANLVFVQTTHVDAATCGLACRVVFRRLF